MGYAGNVIEGFKKKKNVTFWIIWFCFITKLFLSFRTKDVIGVVTSVILVLIIIARAGNLCETYLCLPPLNLAFCGKAVDTDWEVLSSMPTGLLIFLGRFFFILSCHYSYTGFSPTLDLFRFALCSISLVLGNTFKLSVNTYQVARKTRHPKKYTLNPWKSSYEHQSS